MRFRLVIRSEDPEHNRNPPAAVASALQPVIRRMLRGMGGGPVLDDGGRHIGTWELCYDEEPTTGEEPTHF